MSAYSDAVMADSPIAYWRLDETSGNFADFTGKADNEMLVNPAGFPPSYRQPGPIVADGNNFCIHIGGQTQAPRTGTATTELNAIGDVFSWECWFKRDDTSTPEVLISHGDADDNPWLTLETTATAIFINYTRTHMCEISVVADTVWHHIVFTKTGGTMFMYLDGVSVPPSTTTTFTVPSGGTEPWYIGVQNANTEASPLYAGGYVGYIDEVAIYGTVLSAARVAAHFNAARAYAQSLHGSLGGKSELLNGQVSRIVHLPLLAGATGALSGVLASVKLVVSVSVSGALTSVSGVVSRRTNKTLTGQPGVLHALLTPFRLPRKFTSVATVIAKLPAKVAATLRNPRTGS